MAKHFAKLESKIVINGLAKEDEVAKNSAELKELGARTVFYQGINLEKPDEIHSMFERIIKEFGKIDILVNNAGIQHVAPIDEFPEDKTDYEKNGFGRIVNIASAHAYVASSFKSALCGSKARYP
ncbi:SDR family NAD(P)-dependent oxidoreductase [Rickettsia sp. 2024-CO-Wats]|uniref:SDR family NAD(P)-dependent oxidoreductase n=1 Tax=unclassified Rickettsia TaxID=114295 RepID=UPI00370DA839